MAKGQAPFNSRKFGWLVVIFLLIAGAIWLGHFTQTSVEAANSPLPTFTRWLGKHQQKPTRLPTPFIQPTLIPTMEPVELSARLLTAVGITYEVGVEPYTLRRVTGWDYGFLPSNYCQGPYRWLDNNHLLLWPIVGEQESMGIIRLTQPVVINLSVGGAWLPPQENLWDCQGPLWSEALQRLITPHSQQVLLFKADGQVTQTYPGNGPIHLAPSGQRVLTEFVWRDLETGQTVDFSNQHHWPLRLPAWSADETRLFDCCFGFADAQTGSYDFYNDWGELYITGRGSSPGVIGLPRSQWVLSDTRVMVEWDFMQANQPGVIPLLDPTTHTYIDVRRPAHLPAEMQCGAPRIAPNGEHFWVKCFEFSPDSITVSQTGSYLINLSTFISHTLENELELVSWSPDSRFALLGQPLNWATGRGYHWLIASSTGELRSLAETATVSPIWSPDGQTLAYLDETGKYLKLLEITAGVTRTVSLLRVGEKIIWSPQGDSLIVVTDEGRLLWVSPAKSAPTTITPPLPAVRDIHWSPDGQQVAFMSDTDIYVVWLSSPTLSSPPVEPMTPTPTLQLSGSITTYGDAELGFAFDFPVEWQVDGWPGEVAHFYRSDGLGSLLTLSVFGPEIITPALLLDEVRQGEWGAFVQETEPIQLGDFEALRLDLTPADDRPAVMWAFISPSGRAVKFAPAGDPTPIERALTTLRAIPLKKPTPPPSSSSLPTPTLPPENPPVAPPPGLVYRLNDGWLWLINSEGRPTRLINQPYATLSPDGGQVIYDEVGDIWLADVSTGSRRNLTNTPDHRECCARWWPARPGVVLGLTWPRAVEWNNIVNPGFLTAITLKTNERRILNATGFSYIFAPAPDGKTILSLGQGTDWLYDWTGPIRPFDRTLYKLSTPPVFGLTRPDWSPDGKRLALAIGGVFADEHWLGMGVFDLETRTGWFGHPYQPIGFDGYPPGPIWSPDGQWLAFFVPAEIPAKAGLWVIRSNGQAEHTIGTAEEGFWLPTWTPVWSPDGSQLVFTASNMGSTTWLVETGIWNRHQVALPDQAIVVDWVTLEY